MAKRFSHRKKFGNKTYFHVESFHRKTDAKDYATRARKHGYLVRVTKDLTSGLWFVWRTSR